MKEFRNGIIEGIPIALGYISVSFTFGLMAISAGLKWWQAILISMTNLTSAGQFAGVEIMIAGGTMIEMALSQFIINMRYALMSLALSQKVDKSMNTLHRFITGVGITDEIFAVSMNYSKKVNKYYMYGLIGISYIGWAGGTALGAILGSVLPQLLRDSLGIAIYGMFIAIIIPKAKENNRFLKVILIAVSLSCCFRWIPIFSQISSGFVIIICAVIASATGALLYPLPIEKEMEKMEEMEHPHK